MVTQTHSPTARSLDSLGWAMLLALSVIWGASFLFGRIAVAEVPPLTLTLLRVALAALTLNLVLVVFKTRAGGAKGRWRDFAVMGLLNNVIPFTLIFNGQQEIGAGLAAIVNAMTPIWTVLIAHWSTRDERMSPLRLAGVMSGFTGVSVLIGGAAFGGLEASAWAQLSVLGATISYAIAGIFGRRFAAIPPLRTAQGVLNAATLIMIPLACFIDRPWTLPIPSTGALMAVLALAVVCTALAYVLFFRILARAGATNVSLVTFLIPPSAILLGAVFRDEILQPRHGAGFALILLGLALIDGRLRWPSKRRA